MSTNLEIEFKNMLNEDEYKKLLAEFSIDEEKIWTQKNVYFDTPTSQLKNLGAALRIRVKNNTYELTLKTKAEVGLLETNQLITRADYQALKHEHLLVKGPVYDQLKNLNVEIDHLQLSELKSTIKADFLS